MGVLCFQSNLSSDLFSWGCFLPKSLETCRNASERSRCQQYREITAGGSKNASNLSWATLFLGFFQGGSAYFGNAVSYCCSVTEGSTRLGKKHSLNQSETKLLLTSWTLPACFASVCNKCLTLLRVLCLSVLQQMTLLSLVSLLLRVGFLFFV